MRFFLRASAFSVMLGSVTFNILFSQELFPTKNRLQSFYGNATIYPEGKDGFMMASGREYLSGKLTVGHRDLPFGTHLLVKNLSNGKSTEALVVDRGPYGSKNEVLVLSKMAAAAIGATSPETFIKATILELGNVVKTPIKRFEKFEDSKDIPENFSTQESPVSHEEIEAINSTPMDPDTLFDDVLESSETDYLSQNMDATIVERNAFPEISPQRAPYNSVQYEDNSIQNNVLTNPVLSEPEGFKKSNSEIILDDPLDGLDIASGQDDEFVLAPSLSEDMPARNSSGMSPEEELFSMDFIQQDPYERMSGSDSQFFNSEVNSSLSSPIQKTQDVGSNLNADDFSASNIVLPSIPYCPPTACCPPKVPEQCPPKHVEYHNVYPQATVPTVVTPSPTCIHVTCNHGCGSQSQGCGKIETHQSTCHGGQYHSENSYVDKHCAAKVQCPYLVQVGAFGHLHNALNLYNKLKCQNQNVFLSETYCHGMNLTRVRVGYFNTIQEAKNCAKRLRCQGYKARVVRSDS